MTQAAGNDAAGAAAAIWADYRSLASRIDDFFAAVQARHPQALHCQAGCAGCCQEGLSVSAIEAAAIRNYLHSSPPELRRQIARQAQAAQAPDSVANPAARDPLPPRSCVFLDAAEQCAIYPVRPLFCRSQGLPLAYAKELIPAAALRFSARDGRAVVCCPLNFAAAASDPVGSAQSGPSLPGAADILDAQRIDLVLALLNRRFLAASHPGSLSEADLAPAAIARTPLLELASDATCGPQG